MFGTFYLMNRHHNRLFFIRRWFLWNMCHGLHHASPSDFNPLYYLDFHYFHCLSILKKISDRSKWYYIKLYLNQVWNVVYNDDKIYYSVLLLNQNNRKITNFTKAQIWFCSTFLVIINFLAFVRYSNCCEGSLTTSLLDSYILLNAWIVLFINIVLLSSIINMFSN